MNKHIEVIGVRWFGGRSVIGAVLIHDTIVNSYKAYIGTANGENEEADIEMILTYGGKLSYKIASSMFSSHFNWKYIEARWAL